MFKYLFINILCNFIEFYFFEFLAKSVNLNIEKIGFFLIEGDIVPISMKKAIHEGFKIVKTTSGIDLA